MFLKLLMNEKKMNKIWKLSRFVAILHNLCSSLDFHGWH